MANYPLIIPVTPYLEHCVDIPHLKCLNQTAQIFTKKIKIKSSNMDL